MLILFSSDWRIELTLRGFFAVNKTLNTARRCEVLAMPAFCKVNKASLCIGVVIMGDHYQKCNRVATNLMTNDKEIEKILLTNQIPAINYVKSLIRRIAYETHRSLNVGTQVN